jgi:hypoxanthine phosphoribosyltransferase
MDGRVVKVHGPEEIAERVKALGSEISAAYGAEGLTVIGVLGDGFVFLADLLRAITVPVRTAFLRYDHHARGGLQDLSFTTNIDLKGRDVLLVEGVLDTGVPEEYLMRQLEGRGAKRVRLCVLADKPTGRHTSVEADWRAFEVGDDYLVGYGLGFQERWRELPHLATFARG